MVLSAVQQLKPMKDSYIVEVVPKRPDDKVFSELLDVSVCNKQTLSMFGKTILIILLIVSVTVGMHLSFLRLKQGEVTTIKLPFTGQILA